MAKIKRPNIGKDVKQSEVLYIVFLEYKNGIRVFPGGSNGKESACSAGDPGLIPGLGISPGEGNGYPLQYSCLEYSTDRGAWWAMIRGVVQSWTRLKRLSRAKH